MSSTNLVQEFLEKKSFPIPNLIVFMRPSLEKSIQIFEHFEPTKSVKYHFA